MKYILYSLAVVLLGFCGCATVPLSAPTDDAAAKEFEASGSEAKIYVFRDEGFIGSARTLPVLIDGRTIGATAPKTYLVVSVPPGNHKLASTEGRFFSLDLEAQAGRMYFVRHVPHVEFWGASGSLE